MGKRTTMVFEINVQNSSDFAFSLLDIISFQSIDPLKCPSVCVSVCPFVCSLLRYRLNVFLPPLLEVGCPIFLEIRNPWGKVMERSGLRFKYFCSKVV